VRVLDLFSGTRSIANAFEAYGHETFSIELDRRHENIDWYVDILEVTASDILTRFGRPDVIWASPPCTTYSIAAISHHRTRNDDGVLMPKSHLAHISDRLITHTISLIAELKPRFYFIENPRGGLRKMPFMQPMPRYTITYCQYGDKRMKPTDIWTNHPQPDFNPMCHNGDMCHESAPRGSKTGTQGLKGAIQRSIIPLLLCNHIVKICENEINEKYGGRATRPPQIFGGAK